MCVSARGIFSCKGINTLLLQFGLRVVSYSVMMFVRKKLPQQFGVRQWDSLDVTSGPDSGQRLITLELKVPTLPRKKIQRRGTVSAVGTGGIDHWNQKNPGGTKRHLW